ALTQGQVEALLAATDGDDPVRLRDKALLELLYATGARVSEVHIPADARWSARYRSDLLGGITTLESEAIRVPEGDWRGRLYRPLQRQSERVPIRLVPYYAWANRGVSEMTVWMPVQR
ncbi:MAG TPA: tyrosine-type recombinase/integrase, partial [Armatimonadota bacterium]|nr:tyrosine-type recombinase/integrase [Armatimonadota bacterium]